MAVCAAYGLTAFFFYPGTRGYSLEQMADVFDKDEANVPPSAKTYRRASVAAEIETQEKHVSVTTHTEMVKVELLGGGGIQELEGPFLLCRGMWKILQAAE